MEENIEGTVEGKLEGDICNRNGCVGRMILEDVEDCTCHNNPPCSGHENQVTHCEKCGIYEYE